MANINQLAAAMVALSMAWPAAALAQTRGKPAPKAVPSAKAAGQDKGKAPGKPAGPTTTAGAEGPAGIETAVLVLDASGSMNEQIDGQTKLKIAQDAVGALVGKWDAKVPLGLTAYGHQGTGCTDIQTLVPVAAPVSSSFMTQVNGLVAKGKTPLTDAVIAAAEQLDYENNQATIILVSDGEETCGGDPCEMARVLEEKGIDLTVHVVGFSVTGDDSRLSCIATNTGGQYKKVEDAAELNEALGSVVKEVEESKVRWRGKCGKRWGKNGRWVKGRWQGRKPGDDHASFWQGHRKLWRTKFKEKAEPKARAPRRSAKFGPGKGKGKAPEKNNDKGKAAPSKKAPPASP